jgi:predicted nucleic acid-binding protein
VVSFESADAPLPEELLLDTSFVVEALIESQPLHSAAVEFLVRLEGESVRIRYCALLELELAETAFQLALKERHPKDWKRFRHDGRARRRATRLMSDVEEAWGDVLIFIEHDRIELEEVSAMAPLLMSEYGLASYDAVHAAAALLDTSVGIVTTDVGFSALPASRTPIYTDSSRVARCRQLRARAR